MDHNTDIDSLLTKFAEGTANPEETAAVEEWLNADEANRRHLREADMIGLAAAAEHMASTINVDEAYERVRRRMRRKRVPLWTWMERVAAVMFLPLLGSLVYFALTQNPKTVAQTIEVKTNAGMTTTVVLPDSTVVHLNSESVLRYPASFDGDRRMVALQGEAYFDVTHNARKQFVVSVTGGTQVKVYGTSFNVEAYAGEPTVSTTLVEGSVGFAYSDKSGNAKEERLTPGHKLVYSADKHLVAVVETTCQQETAWKDGKVIFNNTPMRDILRTLGRRFNVEFIVSNPRINGYAFTGTISSQRLERIMEYFKLSSGIRWRYADDADLTQERQRIEIY